MRTPAASFSITYVEDGGEDSDGEYCHEFPAEAKTAFEAAANIWSDILVSEVPITIRACWADLGDPSVLGSSGDGPLHPGPVPDTAYNAALANALSGSDLAPAEYDMHITYNKNFNWYFGTDGKTPDHQVDLVSVVLHEICHGLNFSGSANYSSSSYEGFWGYETGSNVFVPDIFDTFLRDGNGVQLTDTDIYPNPSRELGNLLTSEDIWFHGSHAMSANGGQRVKLYAPFIWSAGSSYSHLDYDVFNDTVNQLMVYAISYGESIHDPGTVTIGLLQDLGWRINGSAQTKSTWIGKSTDWNSGENWSEGKPPDFTTASIIPYSPACGHFPVIDVSDASSENIRIQGNCLAIAGGGLLTLRNPYGGGEGEW